MQQPHTPPHRRRGLAARRQRGVYALEWALIFPAFFVLLYAVVCYGLTFLVRESMQYAVEEGARAALRYPSSTLIGAMPPTWQHRSTEARQTAANALRWLPAALRPGASDITFTVCRVADTGCNQKTALNNSQLCDANTPCLVLVSYQVNNYQNGALIPGIPGLGLILPSTLQAQASILVDRRML